MTTDTPPLHAGDKVWAKMAGHPWWPARILDKGECSQDLLKLSRKEGDKPVWFYGEKS